MDKLKILTDNSVALVAESFERLGLLGDPEYPVHFLEGWFKDSLPKADREGRFGSGFAIMRLDGDLYQSTWEGLKWLYPRLNPGGFVIVDDFYDWKGAHDAVLDFRQDHGLDTPLVPVYHDFGDAKDREQLRGVWFRKPD
ncbi:hypothetical protein DFJ74DRAFT_479120 [Hyaloraphidium curvatum]|nr:hypothetical protein DFJ74DRAFT_479120 [Hyaloraphidium curvatum]